LISVLFLSYFYDFHFPWRQLTTRFISDSRTSRIKWYFSATWFICNSNTTLLRWSGFFINCKWV